MESLDAAGWVMPGAVMRFGVAPTKLGLCAAVPMKLGFLEELGLPPTAGAS